MKITTVLQGLAEEVKVGMAITRIIVLLTRLHQQLLLKLLLTSNEDQTGLLCKQAGMSILQITETVCASVI